MNWLQKTANLDDDSVWTYEDYKANINRPEMHNSYEGIGHTSPNTSIWKIDSRLRFYKTTPDPEKVPYEQRHHGLLDDPNVGIFEQDSISHGRVDLDSQIGSINLADNNLQVSNTNKQMKIFDILVSQYPGVRFFVWAGRDKKIPLQRYVEIIS